MSIISKDISRAVELLNAEEVIAIPTETVYGLAGNIYSEKAIKAIFEIKKRPFYNPLIVHIASIDYLDKIVKHVPVKAKLLAENFWPGPLTLVLKKKDTIPDLITAGKNTVAVRVPNHPLSLKLLEQLSYPLGAPSANPFSTISPTKAEHVENYFINSIKMVIDGGPSKSGIESTIIGFVDDEPIIYRLGSIPLEAISKIVGNIKIINNQSETPEAPGMLERHYAPITNTILTDNLLKAISQHSERKLGILSFKSKIEGSNIKLQITLSENGNMKEAASNLYDALHKLDKADLDIIIAERLPDYGLGKSINDRLERATKL
ncbi:MAG: threonylcarbamoyl-AMP synthase [Winogradskyella sp.]|nr:MAG: threonylcarbamoyl-AMP synthase [Winogradskyella sp.]